MARSNEKIKPDLNELSTRERIITAAVHCCADASVDSVTLDDIARVAGVARRTLYHHFDSREQILDAAYAHNSVDFIRKLRRDVDSNQPFPDFVTDAVIYVIEKSPEQPLYNVNIHGDMALRVGAGYFTAADAVAEWFATFQPSYIRALQERNINTEVTLDEIVEFIGRIGLSFLQHPRTGKNNLPSVRTTLQRCFTNALRYDPLSTTTG